VFGVNHHQLELFVGAPKWGLFALLILPHGHHVGWFRLEIADPLQLEITCHGCFVAGVLQMKASGGISVIASTPQKAEDCGNFSYPVTCCWF